MLLTRKPNIINQERLIKDMRKMDFKKIKITIVQNHSRRKNITRIKGQYKDIEIERAPHHPNASYLRPGLRRRKNTREGTKKLSGFFFISNEPWVE